MRVSKWGNSLAVRLPQELVQDLGLAEGDEIEMIAGDLETFIVHKLDDPEVLLERIRRFRGRMPKGFRFDRDADHERS